MQRRRGIFGAFLFFLFIALLLFFAFRSTLLQGIIGIFEQGTLPLQRSIHTTLWGIFTKEPEAEGIAEENRKLRQKLITYEELKKENNALHDQFKTTEMNSYDQIPSRIVGMKGFIPGVSLPTELVIDKGAKNGVKVGNVVVYKNSIIGKVVRVTPRLSVVDPLTKNGVSFTGKDLVTNALGVVKGQGDGIVLDNVVLAEKINVGDIIISKGDLNEEGIGIPPDLVIGKIASVDRRPSNLFQSAEIQSLVDLTTLTTIFVVKVKE